MARKKAVKEQDQPAAEAPSGETSVTGPAASQAEAPEPEAAPAEAPAAGPPGEEEAREAEEMPAGAYGPTDVRGILAMTMGMLAEAAWAKLGLRVDPLTGKIERDLQQARLAIDCLGDLAQRVLPHEDEWDRRELNNLLTDLRLNFVRQQQQQG